MTDRTAFSETAADLLGPKGWTQDQAVLDPWLTDWRGRYRGAAFGMASPASTKECAGLVALAAQHGVAIVPQGGNSSMSGGATPDASGDALLLSLRRMDTIRTLDPAAGEAVCEAGVILQTLHEAAERERLRFPLTLGGKGSATIGGLIATNAGGTQVLRHGTMRAQVLGIEAVLADGQVFDGLTALKKDNRGFDLKQLLIGSEGTLGIVTAARLRLLPEIAERCVVWAGVDSVHAARELLLHFERGAADLLEGFEVMPRHSLAAVLDHLPDAQAPLDDDHQWNALIELVADEHAAPALRERTENLLAAAFEAGLVADATIAANETQAEALWLLRDAIAPAERELGPAMQHDISVPVARMPDFIEQSAPQVEAAFPGTRVVAFGHLGDGNVHYHVLAPHGVEVKAWEAGEARAISALVHDLVDRAGGSISAEHGIGRIKVGELERLSDPVRLAMMRGVKRALDPAGLLNPGVLLAS